VVAFIIPREGTSIDDIKQRLKGKLISYMLPTVNNSNFYTKINIF
jgi:hypothetical protein